jgi:hypothetical protein
MRSRCCLCVYTPTVTRHRLGGNSPIVARQRFGKNPPTVARQRLNKIPLSLLGNGSVRIPLSLRRFQCGPCHIVAGFFAVKALTVL